MITKTNKHTLEVYRDLIDVTSNHRPDIDWEFIDSHGHIHKWSDSNGIATQYDPKSKYLVLSVKWKTTGTGYYEDGSEYDIGHYECTKCGDIVKPGYTTDKTTQYITGLTHYLVDGRHVSEQEFMSVLGEEEGVHV